MAKIQTRSKNARSDSERVGLPDARTLACMVEHNTITPPPPRRRKGGRYTEHMTTYLSKVEDKELIADILSTYGYSKAEKFRNWVRAHSGIDYSNMKEGDI